MINYQLTKTLRFGLTKVRKEKKHLSHEELDDLVMISEERIKNEKTQNIPFNEQSFIKDIRDCSDKIKDYLLSWGKVCKRVDKITVRKEFFKILSRKTFFKYESKVGKKKTPLPSEVKLSGQRGDNIYGEPINEGISQYWQNNVYKALKLHSQFEVMLEEYEQELAKEKYNQAHKNEGNKQVNKPHLVDFRKLFLAVCGLVMDSLRPIVNELIVVSDNVSDKDEYILDFVNNKPKQWDLFSKIETLQDTIRDNGGNVYFGKATLNKYTAEQVPNRQGDNIDKIINELRLEDFVSEYIGLSPEEICKKIYISTKYSLDNLNNKRISPIIRAQFFKYKPIPVLIRFALADYLSKRTKKDSKDIMLLFSLFGMSHSPAFDYSQLSDKTNFSLDNYPIKVAFDFAWEQCARSKYANKPVDFPKEICENFLETYFKYNSDEKNHNEFEIYAHLLKINECLATLEHFENEPPKDIESIYKDVEKHLDEVKVLFSKDKIEQKDLNAITNWYAKYKTLWSKRNNNELKKWLLSKDRIITDFTQAKMHLGQKRGSQKSLVLKSYFHPSYGQIKDKYGKSSKSNVTEVFKNIASTFGKKFASIREYFNEESEVNKIGYGAVIIEDPNHDKYLLLQKKNEGGIELPIFTTFCNNGDYFVYQVKSLTSKSVNKIISSINKYPTFSKGINVEYPNKKEDPKYKIDPNDRDEVKEQKRQDYKNALVQPIIESLTISEFAKEEELSKFDCWDCAIKQCKGKSLEQLYKTIDQKGYGFTPKKISKEQIEDLVNNRDCLLLPIVNQNITAKNKNDKNQFTKDWNRIFDEEDKDCRLHPEFTMFYRFPTPDYPCSGEKRYSRFQMNVNFLMEVIPSEGEYISRKEQVEAFNNKKEKDSKGNVNKNSQEQNVKQFNDKVNEKKPTYIIGIDRGINELATLCVIDSKGKIVGDFEIYKREFDTNSHSQKYSHIDTRSILDLSNLRVEQNSDGKLCLVDLSASEVWEDSLNHDLGKRENKQISKLKKLYYLRCLTYLLQSPEYKSIVLERLKDCNQMTDNQIEDVFKQEKFITPYKGGSQYTDLPFKEIKKLISDYNAIEDSNMSESEQATELNRLCQLDATESLKKGVVANMIGVVVYVLKKLNYDAYISLENLCRAYGFSKDSLSGYTIESTTVNPDLDFKDQENAKLAGLGTYSYFEIQLLKKLFKLQIENEQLLVPAFRSVENYEKIFQLEGVENKIYQFGIVFFVDPANTSHRCPICGANGKKNVDRKKHNDKYDEDELVCKQCGFHSNLSHIETNDKVMEDSFIKKYYVDHNLSAIISGDANAGYNIAFRLGKNIIPEMGKEIDKLHNAGSKYKKIK